MEAGEMTISDESSGQIIARTVPIRLDHVLPAAVNDVDGQRSSVWQRTVSGHGVPPAVPIEGRERTSLVRRRTVPGHGVPAAVRRRTVSGHEIPAPRRLPMAGGGITRGHQRRVRQESTNPR